MGGIFTLLARQLSCFIRILLWDTNYTTRYFKKVRLAKLFNITLNTCYNLNTNNNDAHLCGNNFVRISHKTFSQTNFKGQNVFVVCNDFVIILLEFCTLILPGQLKEIRFGIFCRYRLYKKYHHIPQ